MTSFISPYRADRDMVRQRCQPGECEGLCVCKCVCVSVRLHLCVLTSAAMRQSCKS
jgi:adenylylsulfate kinase-like enzyme